MSHQQQRVEEQILDATCGSRSIWHPENKDHDQTLYIDLREEPEGYICEGHDFETNPNDDIDPDEQEDFRDLPYPDESFNLAVFDPPHAIRGDGMEQLKGISTKRWGALNAETWQSDIRQGFEELFRVLKPGGTLIFKFADESADFEEVLSLAPQPPLFGTCSNNGTTETRWFVFYKEVSA